MKKSFNRSVLEITTFLLVFITILSAAILTHALPFAHAEESSVSTATVTVLESCSMAGTVNTPHDAVLQNGTYSGTDYPNGVGTTTLKAYCNDSAGFAIYAIGYTNNEYGNTTLHSDALGSDYDINTGLYQQGSANSSWSMKLASVSGTYAPTVTDGTNSTENFTTWHTVPTLYTKVAYRASGTDAENEGEGIGSSLTTTYDIYVSPTQTSGTYIGQVKYTLVHPSTTAKPLGPLQASDCPAGYVCYAPNANDIEGSMVTISDETIASSDQAGKISIGQSASATPTLIAPNYKRSGYGFAGWSTSFEATNSSIIYGPNETITVDLSNSGLILYPVWVENAGNLQGWTGCSSLTTAPTNTRATLSSVTALTDTRDGNIYAVARLADGKCWMIENLRLDDSATITVSNTHNPLHDANNDVILNANGTTATHLAASNNTWCGMGSDACVNQTMLNTNNTRISDSSLTASYDGIGATYKWYGYGNYYNWYSATAGNGTFGFATLNDSVAGDLCPIGWHLPIGGNKNNSANSEFWALGVALVGAAPADAFYTGNTEGKNASKVFRAYPSNFTYSGSWSNSSANNYNYRGSYWSSSVNSDYYALRFAIEDTVVVPATDPFYKYDGLTVRCVAGP